MTPVAFAGHRPSLTALRSISTTSSKSPTFPQILQTSSLSIFRSRSTTAGRLSSLFSPPLRHLAPTQGATLLAFGRRSLFSSRCKSYFVPTLIYSHCVKVLLRGYCCGICVCYHRRRPSCCDRDHVVPLRHLRPPAFGIHSLVRSRFCSSLPRLGPQRSYRSFHLVARWRNCARRRRTCTAHPLNFPFLQSEGIVRSTNLSVFYVTCAVVPNSIVL